MPWENRLRGNVGPNLPRQLHVDSTTPPRTIGATSCTLSRIVERVRAVMVWPPGRKISVLA